MAKIMEDTLQIAILIEKNVEDAEFQVPYAALRKTNARVVILGSRMNEEYRGKQGRLTVRPEGTTTEARAEDYAAVIIPGGQAPDVMRTNLKTVRFVQEMMGQGKLVAAVCHGPQVLIEGDLLRGRRATGFRSIRKDMQNAGAEYVNEPVVTDGNLITSRRPGDLPLFTTAILRHLGLRIPETTLPELHDLHAGWWKLAAEWNGSSRSEIAEGINTALTGERYAVDAFERYTQATVSEPIQTVFKDIIANKRNHIQQLAARLALLGERESLQAQASGAYATIKNLLQTRTDNIGVLRQALSDLQNGVVDTYQLCNKYTDPTTTAIFDEMEVDLAQDEERVAELYLAQRDQAMQPAQPSTGATV